MIYDIYVFIFSFKLFKQIIQLINADRQFKVLLICSNLSKFPKK